VSSQANYALASSFPLPQLPSAQCAGWVRVRQTWDSVATCVSLEGQRCGNRAQPNVSGFRVGAFSGLHGASCWSPIHSVCICEGEEKEAGTTLVVSFYVSVSFSTIHSPILDKYEGFWFFFLNFTASLLGGE
jgi:hypothetical protein